MQLYLLSRLLRLFDDELRTASMIEQDRGRIRGQLDKFVFTQFLIGMPQDRIVRLFLRMVVWLSFLVGPVLLLLGFQLRFLPYHNVPVTYVHRAVLLLDLTLLLLLWPRISRSGVRPTQVLNGHSALWRFAGPGLCGAVLVVFSLLIATVPGEPTDQDVKNFTQLYLFSRSLSLPGERLVEPDEDKLSKLAQTLSLRGRNFRRAVLYYTDFRKANLSSTFRNSGCEA
jgi:hypothetical protein